MNARTLLESTSAALPARERRTVWKALENCCAREWLPAQAREGSHFGASIAECMPTTGPAQRAYFTHGTAAATVEEMACRQYRHQRFRTYILTCPVTILLALCTVACSRSREYELRGQVLAVNAARQEITVKHEDIRGFMPAMTMPFRVENAREIEGRRPGELVRATLVVETNDAYLKNVERTGEAPLTSAYLPPSSAVLLDAWRGGGRTGVHRSAWTVPPPVGIPRKDPRRHIHIHTLSNPRLLSADGSALRVRTANACR